MVSGCCCGWCGCGCRCCGCCCCCVDVFVDVAIAGGGAVDANVAFGKELKVACALLSQILYTTSVWFVKKRSGRFVWTPAINGPNIFLS